jgi:hypothetical protein
LPTADFLGPAVSLKAPPTEKPPPPPLTPETLKKDVWLHQKILSDEELDQQEQEIIASLENSEREHLKYKEKKVQAMKGEFNEFPTDGYHFFNFKNTALYP